MADPNELNSQVPDAVTKVNAKALADAPAMAMGHLYESTAHALGILAENAVSAQTQTNIMAQAATTMGVSTLYSVDTAATGIDTVDLLRLEGGPDEAAGKKEA